MVTPDIASDYAIQPMAEIEAVTVSHEHSDHSNVAIAQGSPVIIWGLKDNDWVKVSQTVKDTKMATVATFTIKSRAPSVGRTQHSSWRGSASRRSSRTA